MRAVLTSHQAGQDGQRSWMAQLLGGSCCEWPQCCGHLGTRHVACTWRLERKAQGLHASHWQQRGPSHRRGALGLALT